MHLSAKQPVINRFSVDRAGWDWLAAALFLTAVTFASLRLTATQWTEHLLGTLFLAVLAGCFGLLLGQSLLPRGLILLYGLFYGTFFISLVLGFQLHGIVGWDDRLRLLAQRVAATLSQVNQGKPASDAILFLLAISILFWLMGSYSGYHLSRHRDAGCAILPFGLAAVIVQLYDPLIPSRSWFIFLFLCFALLLTGRIHLLKQESKWGNSRIQEPLGTADTLQRIALWITISIVLVAWAIPSLPSSLEEAGRLWDRLASQGKLESKLGLALDPLKGPPLGFGEFFGPALSLGRGIPHSQSVLFTVKPVTPEPEIQHYYWRDRVYDHYENGKWTGQFSESEQLVAQEETTWIIGKEKRFPETFEFKVEAPTWLLHSPSQTLSLNLPVRTYFAKSPDGNVDLASFQVQNALIAGESYSVTSWLTEATAAELQDAGTAYPSWISQKYLQVPEEITERTRRLALRLTQNQSTPYDKALVITDYLRTNIAYHETLPILPARAEPIDWMLFQQKQAFCNYYASAEVILLRIAGIPARLAVGFAQGQRNLQSNGTAKYIVRENNAHAWPEVFFPGIGWVEFEPTANQAALIRPVEPQLIANNNPTTNLPKAISDIEQPDLSKQTSQSAENNPPPNLQRATNSIWMLTLILIGMTGLFVLALWKQRKPSSIRFSQLVILGFDKLEIKPPAPLVRWAERERLPKISRIYMEINHGLRRLGQVPLPGATSRQRAKMLAKTWPDLGEKLFVLAEAYERQLFSSRAQTIPDLSNHIQRQIRFRSILAAARMKWQKRIYWLVRKKIR